MARNEDTPRDREFTSMSIDVETHQLIKRLAGEGNTADYIRDLVKAFANGNQFALEALRGEYSLGDVKISVDALRRHLERRIEGLRDEIERLHTELQPAKHEFLRRESEKEEQRLRDLCRQVGLDYDGEVTDYLAWVKDYVENHAGKEDRQRKAEREEKIKRGDAPVMFEEEEVQLPLTFDEWLNAKLVQRLVRELKPKRKR